MKKTPSRLLSKLGFTLAFLVSVTLGLGLGAACSVSFPEDAKYVCGVAEDCGGDGYVCAPSGYCCKPAPELCDGIDTDCDGVLDNDPTDLGQCYSGDAATRGVGRCTPGNEVCQAGAKVCQGEVLPGAEVCNGIDDDCDGTVDEDFDLQTDEQNCGVCNGICVTNQTCNAGVCPLSNEPRCGDGLDDDNDGQIDCADSDCINKSCGAGCICSNFNRAENICDDGVDNDNDGSVDCADLDCRNRFCETGTSKRCRSNGTCAL